MAICKFGTTVVGVRGTMAGATYSANATGSYVRAWSRGGNAGSAAQGLVRGRMGAYGAAWAGMGAVLRAAWQAFAQAPPETDYNSLGEVILLSGWMWFVRVNQRRASLGLAMTTTVPTNSAVAAVTWIDMSVLQGPPFVWSVWYAAGQVPAGYGAVYYVTVHPTRGLLNKSVGWLLGSAVYGPASRYTDLAPFCVSHWGSLSVGWTVWAELYKVRADGVSSSSAALRKEVA